MTRLPRALSGAVTAGLVMLAICVVVTAYLGSTRGFPGPGMLSVIAHIAAAVIAVFAQRTADRRRGFLSGIGVLVVLTAAGLVLYTQWWN